MRQLGLMGSSVRAGTVVRPMSIGQTFTLSIGGRPEAAARWSVGSTPAIAARVPYQSAIEIVPSHVVPCADGGR